MKLQFVATVVETTPRVAPDGKLFCDVLVDLPTFGDKPAEKLALVTSGASAEHAKRLIRGARVFVDARLSSMEPKGERRFWATSVYAFSIEPIGTTQAQSAGRGYGGDPF